MSDNLQRAITAIRSGDKETGKRLLAEVIRNDPRNETAWLWMSAVIDSDEHRRYCLERVLAINPRNETARRGLEALSQSTSDVSNARSAPSGVSQELSQTLESRTVTTEGPDMVSESGLPTSSVVSVARDETRKNAMQTIKRTWSGGLVGKLLIGCGALTILSCVCAVPLTIFGSLTGDLYATPPSELAGLSAEQSSPVVATETPLPTFTLMPAPVPSETPITQPTAALVPPAPTPPSQGTTARVVTIIDGDTIEVEIDGVTYRLRYIGMDTPEQGMPFFAEATQANADLVAGRDVRLEKDVSETDRYGRLLRYVYVGDTMVNADLVRQGFAQVATYPPDVKYQEQFRALQQDAQAAGAGLWGNQAALPEPTEPAQPVAGALTIIQVNDQDECVDIQNMGGEPVDLTGWHLLSERGAQDCVLGGMIQPGGVLRIWARAEDANKGGYNCGFGSNIWNNSEPDAAILYNPNGVEVSRGD